MLDAGIFDEADSESLSAGAKGEIEVLPERFEVGIEAACGLKNGTTEQDGGTRECADLPTGRGFGEVDGQPALPAEIKSVEEKTVAGVVDSVDRVWALGENDAGLVDAFTVGKPRLRHGFDEVRVGFGVVIEKDDGALANFGHPPVGGGGKARRLGLPNHHKVAAGWKVQRIGMAHGHHDLFGRQSLIAKTAH